MFSVTPVIDLTKSFTEEAEQLYNYFFHSEAPFLTANYVNNNEKKMSWKKSEIFLGWRKNVGLITGTVLLI